MWQSLMAPSSLVCPRRSLRDALRMVHEFLQLQCFPIKVLDPTEDGCPHPTLSIRSMSMPSGIAILISHANAVLIGGNCGSRLTASAIEAKVHAALRGVKLANELFFSRIQKSWSLRLYGSIVPMSIAALGIGFPREPTKQRMLQLFEQGEGCVTKFGTLVPHLPGVCASS